MNGAAEDGDDDENVLPRIIHIVLRREWEDSNVRAERGDAYKYCDKPFAPQGPVTWICWIIRTVPCDNVRIGFRVTFWCWRGCLAWLVQRNILILVNTILHSIPLPRLIFGF